MESKRSNSNIHYLLASSNDLFRVIICYLISTLEMRTLVIFFYRLQVYKYTAFVFPMHVVCYIYLYDRRINFV